MEMTKMRCCCQQDEDSYNEDPKYAQEVQDDAVMHAVHTNKELKDLYLYDFKSYSRLTDKTYEAVTNGNEYAVILFTHEFNPKALAALSSFIGIHRTYKEGSPLHRVECFDWPDVCQKAGITTYPRMFFYRPGSDRKPIEYHGIWMQSEMENAINRHALPWPRIITKEKELETMKPHSRPVVCGLIVTDQGEKIFTEAAQQLGSDYEVIMFKKLALNAIKSYVKAKNWDGKSDLVAVNIKHKFLPHTQTFTSVDEVKQGVATALEQKWTEMTVVNFQKLMSAPEPLVIQYVDKSANKKVERDLTDAFKKIANSKEFDGKIIFTWMDSSPNTPGEYALNIHSGGKWEGAPIVFFDKKGSVMFRDVINAENKSAKWLTDCLAGKIEATYKLRDEEWKGRLPGYDLLQIMKDEGTYPVFPKKEVEEKQETVPRGPVHSGKQKKVVPQEPKEEGNQPKHTEL
uniref:Thioredoxin domain-containing protein 16-like n=1 Tax=Ciona intestinalis TaxID=7719 RepID=F6R2Z8_CIOIN|nr:thioredoxin domain-containing protein 16-like [Ciona intestinalis]|eukprot:XP_002126329.1 thioredoxin domain-containing protein 16-like [Ciona intestinalis]